jgi:XRE family transcriptional regulator of biofilm formation
MIEGGLNMQFYGNKLKRVREAKKLSITDLAKTTGLPQGYISELESGKKKNPGPKTVEKLAKALGIEDIFFYLPESRLTIDVLPDLPEDVQDFIMQQNSVSWLALTKDAEESGVSLETLRGIIEALKLNKKTP